MLASKLVGLYCGSPVIWEYDEHRRIASKLRDYHHTLVNETINMILDIEKQGNQQQAIALMWKLWLTLQRYRELCDSQRRGALFDMAGFLERNGDRDEHQDVLATIADITDPCAPKPDPDPCHLLATSILEDDDGLLDKFWQMHFPKSTMPSNVVLKPLQCAAQHGNPKVADTVLSRQSGYETGPAIFKLEGLHVAAFKGNVDTLSTLIKNGNIDARTDHNQTPLFLAAAYGQESCCGLLLGHNADTNARDKHGHTILEVAAKGGNLNIVKMLVDYRADLVAPVHYCCSTPLQAAIESGSLEVVQYLLDQGVDVSPQRAYDNETALSLAQARGLPSVVSRLQDIEASRQSNQFMMPRSYNDERNTWR